MKVTSNYREFNLTMGPKVMIDRRHIRCVREESENKSSIIYFGGNEGVSISTPYEKVVAWWTCPEEES